MIDLLQSIGIALIGLACLGNSWLIYRGRKDRDGGA